MYQGEKVKNHLVYELQWVNYRMQMLDIIEKKLLQMKELAERAKEDELSSQELEALNTKLNNLAVQVNALDEESRKTEHAVTGE
jgi:hypothetical protein